MNNQKWISEDKVEELKSKIKSFNIKASKMKLPLMEFKLGESRFSQLIEHFESNYSVSRYIRPLDHKCRKTET